MPSINTDYWVKIKGEGYYRYELAGNNQPANWQFWIRNLLENGLPSDWLTYQDEDAGNYRTAQIVEGRLESAAFITTKGTLPERNGLTGLFTEDLLALDQRRHLLSGTPYKGASDTGTIICACFNVGEKTIRNIIQKQGLTTVKAVGQCLKAGTNCGSCVPEIKALLATQR